MADSYTAYHLYGNRQFQEAQNGSREPYTIDGYDCPHSQRAFLGSYDHYGQRIQDDAAGVGNCCGEPIELFANRQQFMELDNPTKSKECSKLVKPVTCTDFQMSSLPWTSTCAGGSLKRLSNLLLSCQDACPDDLMHLPYQQVVTGSEGDWYLEGMESEIEIYGAFEIHQTKMDLVYNSCSGPVTIVESFCGNQTISVTINGDLGNTGGCGCDCCGDNGVFTPPSGVITPPSTGTASYGNTITLGAAVNSPACSGGTLTRNFYSTPYGYQGAQAVGSYVGSGSSIRKIQEDAPVVGAASYPACCGGTVYWNGTNGCTTGSNPTQQTSIVNAGYSGTPTATYYGGTEFADGKLEVGDTFMIQVDNSCPSSSHAFIHFGSTTCLQNSDMGDYANSGFYQRRSTGAITLSTGSDCDKCCGNGSFEIDWDNGCGVTGTIAKDVRPAYGTSVIGWSIQCVAAGAYYQTKRYKIKCDGSIDYSSYVQDSTNHADVATCVTYAQTNSTFHSGLCSTPPTGASCGTCCYYADNGLTGTSYMGQTFCVTGTSKVCCTVFENNAAWINGDWTTSKCCPRS